MYKIRKFILNPPTNYQLSIILASVLKPIDDVRMYRKIARSLAKEYQVHVIGFTPAESMRILDKHIHFYPLYQFHRLNPKRLLVAWLFFRQARRIKPDLIIVHAVELVWVAILYKWLYKTPLIYDVRENYYRNIRYQNIYPYPLKRFIAAGIRLFEYLTRTFIDHYLLAEKAYREELSFVKNKQTIIENKALANFTKQPFIFNKNNLRLLYSGTISVVYGALEAISLTEALRSQGINAQLTFAGVFAEKKLGQLIQNKSQQTDYIHLMGGTTLLSHERIIESFHQTDMAVLPYRPNKSTENCIPTKLYECLSIACPMIIQLNLYWQKLCERHQAAVWIDFQKINIIKLIEEIKTKAFYPQKSVRGVFWGEEEEKLLQECKKLLRSSR